MEHREREREIERIAEKIEKGMGGITNGKSVTREAFIEKEKRRESG